MVKWHRPVVIRPDAGAAIPLSVYKQENGGTPSSGWSKLYYSENGTDASELIADMAWLMGENLFPSSWYDNLAWYAGTGGYTNDDTAQSTASATVTITVVALDEDENALGTIYTLTIEKSELERVTIASLVITALAWDNDVTLTGADGGYDGPANAIRVEIAWSASAATTLDTPIVGGVSASVTPYAYLSQVAK